ncbi:hypothetical protein I4F81_006495 [Pyropia yezoensis]|uniref:Uncharacterized protein n=1 Tax=Pyropia yezoensis TaxID=2788 RepID=A0ACC3C2D3_PYRYE|nr:hypothetical protein I4F81_006495 [Neopyropia yezoensis]
MHLDTYMCSTQTCEWVSVYGRENGIVIYTACTAASAVLMRKWAFALVLAGIAFSSSFEAWRRHNEFEKFKMAALYKVLDRIWAMDQSVIELARAVLKRIRHVLSTNIGNSRPVHRDAADVATAAHVRAWLDGMLPPVVDIPGGVANRGGGGDGHSEDSSEGGS